MSEEDVSKKTEDDEAANAEEEQDAALSEQGGDADEKDNDVKLDEDNEEDDDEDEKPSKPSKAGEVRVGRFTVNSAKQFTHLGNEDVLVYQAMGPGDVGECAAFICASHLPPRRAEAEIYAAFMSTDLLPLVGGQKVFWPPAGEERFVFIYRNVMKTPLLKSDSGPAACGYKVDDVLKNVVAPMVNIFLDFEEKDFFHGSIRPSNMFNTGPREKLQKVYLGDCLTGPYSYAQPALYEPITRAMADQLGRGEGTMADDLYALGVSVAVLLRHHDTTHGMSDEDIVKQKIERGSYALITAKDRFKGNISELLRGLLQDDPSERWTLEEMRVWLDGTRLNPRQSAWDKKAPRPMHLAGKKYLMKSLLAMDLEKFPEETHKAVESDDLNQWISRALEDDETVEFVETAIEQAGVIGSGAGHEDRLACLLSAALDPRAPLRYKGIHVSGEGLGAQLAKVMTLGKDVSPYVDIINHGLMLSWARFQDSVHVDVAGLLSRYDSCRNYLRQQRIGYGIERVLYTLLPEMQCLSPKLKGYYISTPEGMLRAFEKMCKADKAPGLFLDRHSIAFLAARENQLVDSHLYELDSPEEHRKILGNLKCLANIQRRAKMKPMKNVAKAFLKMMPKVYARYHDANIRKKIEKNMKKYVAQGDLDQMSKLLTNNEIKKKDMSEFRMAMSEYAKLVKEEEALEEKMKNQETFGKQTGKESAAVVSSIISGLIILVLTFLFFTNNLG